MGKTRVFLSGLVIAGCLSAVTGFAQNTNSADLRGSVTDPKGDLVSGATVTVLDVDKNLTRTFVTDKSGLYDTGSIVPDHYLVTISAPGFKTLVRGPITLNVGTETLNGELTVGEVHEQVVVTTELPLLETESGSQTESLEANTMSELPQYGSDWQNFVFLIPGSQFSYRSGQVASINGNLPYNSVLSDGATTTLPMSTNSDVTVFESTAEVKVDSNSFSAQYGLGGIIFNQITKGGGDKFHGSAYEYFQNDDLNAADYSLTTTKNGVAFQRYDNYGFSVGGPVLIPHMKKNVFFYFDYDKTYSNGGSGNTTLSVPTDAMKSGDFTGLPTVFDYSTQQLSYTSNGTPITVRESYADEYGNGNKLPANAQLSAVNQQFQKFYPEPNVTSGVITSPNGLPLNNYTTNVPNLGPFTKFFGRLDYTPVANHRFTISETESDNPAISYGNGKYLCPINCQNQDVSRDNAQISDVWTVNANMVNEARIGFTDQLNFFSPFSQGEGYPAKMGIKWAVADAIPPVDMMSLSSLSEPSNSIYKEFVFDPTDVFTLVHGRHILHFGGEFLISRADSTAWGNENPGETYFGGYYSDGCLPDQTQAGGCWNNGKSSIGQQNNDDAEYADFLLGYSAMWWGNETPEFGARIKNPQAFVQDDIKLRPNLTVNLGLRWFGTTGFSEVKGNMTTFDPKVVNGAPAGWVDRNGNPSSGQLGGMWYGFSHANNRTTLQAPIYTTFLPRVGVSWSYDPKTVVRGGFGLYNYSWSEDTYGGGMGGAAGLSGGAWDPSNGIYYQLQMDSDGTVDSEQGYGKSVKNLIVSNPTTPYAQNGNSPGYNQYHTPVPKIWQYNLTVERQIGNTMMGSVAYVGSRAWNLNFGVDINQVPAASLSAIDNAPGTVARPYPIYQGIGGSTNNAISNYNSLQIVFQKRVSHGLEFNTNYTWSKFLDDMDSAGWGSSVGTQTYQNSYCVKCNWGPSNFDQRQVFSFSGVYTLPFGKGAQFLNNNLIADEVLGGWRLAATSRENTGAPFTPTMAAGDNNTYAQAGTQYPNLVGNPIPKNRTIDNWFNKEAYAFPGYGVYGNVHRNSVSGPPYSNLDLSFGKTFDLAEKMKFEVRADARNSLNHASFSGPDSSIENDPTQSNPAKVGGVTDGGRHIQLYGKFTF
ncbi:MAG: carboxypeptidase-like regulatory domain-containing protein [Terracidiphilus sp.]